MNSIVLNSESNSVKSMEDIDIIINNYELVQINKNDDKFKLYYRHKITNKEVELGDLIKNQDSLFKFLKNELKNFIKEKLIK